MRARWLGQVFAVGLLCALSLSHSAAPALEELLQQADALRSSDAGQFGRLLHEINAQKQSANAWQLQRLHYLNAYRKVVSGDFEDAAADLKQLLLEADRPDFKLRVAALLANDFAITRQFSQSLSYLDAALALTPQVRDRNIRQQALLAAAVIYNQIGQYALGAHYADMVLSDEPNPRSRCVAGHARLEALAHQGKLPSNSAYQDIIELCQGQQEPIAANLARVMLAKTMLARGEGDSARALLLEYRHAIEATHYPYLIAELYATLGDIALAHGHIDQAAQWARRAVEQRSETPMLPIVQGYRIQYDAAVKRGDIAAALEFHDKYAAADEHYLREVQARELAFQLASQGALQRAHSIESLNKQDEALRLP